MNNTGQVILGFLAQARAFGLEIVTNDAPDILKQKMSKLASMLGVEDIESFSNAAVSNVKKSHEEELRTIEMLASNADPSDITAEFDTPAVRAVKNLIHMHSQANAKNEKLQADLDDMIQKAISNKLPAYREQAVNQMTLTTEVENANYLKQNLVSFIEDVLLNSVPLEEAPSVKERFDNLMITNGDPETIKPYQSRVHDWLLDCFSKEIADDGIERNHRFLEEALELVQSLDCTSSEAHQLVDYVFNRPVGEPYQEVGGVMATFAALCSAHDLDMDDCGEVELARIWIKKDQIREKQAAKPKHSPLPMLIVSHDEHSQKSPGQ